MTQKSSADVLRRLRLRLGILASWNNSHCIKTIPRQGGNALTLIYRIRRNMEFSLRYIHIKGYFAVMKTIADRVG